MMWHFQARGALLIMLIGYPKPCLSCPCNASFLDCRYRQGTMGHTYALGLCSAESCSSMESTLQSPSSERARLTILSPCAGVHAAEAMGAGPAGCEESSSHWRVRQPRGTLHGAALLPCCPGRAGELPWHSTQSHMLVLAELHVV